jgi:hypothetical protein
MVVSVAIARGRVVATAKNGSGIGRAESLVIVGSVHFTAASGQRRPGIDARSVVFVNAPLMLETAAPAFHDGPRGMGGDCLDHCPYHWNYLLCETLSCPTANSGQCCSNHGLYRICLIYLSYQCTTF